MHKRLFFLLSYLLIQPFTWAADVEVTLATLDKWVQTQQILSSERNEWEQEKAFLIETRKLLQQEIEGLQDTIELLERKTSEGDKKRIELLNTRSELRQYIAAMQSGIVEHELTLKKLVPYLPKHTQSELQRALAMLPEDPENTEVAVDQRFTGLLSVLKNVQKANDTIKVVGESRTAPDGTIRQSMTLYWGLAFAWASGTKGEAYYGTPAEDSWKFGEQGDSASEAQKLLAIAEGTTDSIAFVNLPIRIQKIDTKTPPQL